MKILITGGHLTPALAFIDYVRAHAPADQLVYVGRKYSQEKFKQESIEATEVGKRKGVSFKYFTAPKMSFDEYWTVFYQLHQLFDSISKAKVLIQEEQPDVIVSFGGYLALPLAWAGHRLGLPVITHEQTRSAGLANRLIAKFADVVAISFAETTKSFPKMKTILTGNLLRPTLLQRSPTTPQWFKNPSKLPILYITGGSQGALAINTVAEEALPALLQKWCVVHQAGRPSSVSNPQKVFAQLSAALPKELQERYFFHEWLSESDLNWIYDHASIAVSRAGANTVMELSIHSVPTVFIPLPNSHGQEQLLNARSMSDVGAAEILLQPELTPNRLIATVEKLQANQLAMRKAAQSLQELYPRQSLSHFYQIVSKLAGEHKGNASLI